MDVREYLEGDAELNEVFEQSSFEFKDVVNQLEKRLDSEGYEASRPEFQGDSKAVIAISFSDPDSPSEASRGDLLLQAERPQDSITIGLSTAMGQSKVFPNTAVSDIKNDRDAVDRIVQLLNNEINPKS